MEIQWPQVLQILLGTSPLLAAVLSLLGVVIWNLMDVRAMRTDFNSNFDRIETELKEIRKELSKITERVAILEERDRHTPQIIR